MTPLQRRRRNHKKMDEIRNGIMLTKANDVYVLNPYYVANPYSDYDVLNLIKKYWGTSE